jgi:hypothetical protein
VPPNAARLAESVIVAGHAEALPAAHDHRVAVADGGSRLVEVHRERCLGAPPLLGKRLQRVGHTIPAPLTIPGLLIILTDY